MDDRSRISGYRDSPMPDEPTEFFSARPAIIATCREMESLLSSLGSEPERVGEVIHALRKKGKVLRGALVMIGESKASIRRIALIGGMLGQARDAVVRLKTLSQLLPGEVAKESAESALLSLLEQEAYAASRQPPAEVVEWSLAALAKVRDRLEVKDDAEIAAAAAEGATKLERQFVKRLKRALDRVRNQDFHDCRKTAKAWLGGMALTAPERALRGGQEAAQLADALGEENDLEVLSAWLSAQGFTHSICPTVWKVLRKRQEKVRRQSISLIRKEVLSALKSAD